MNFNHWIRRTYHCIHCLSWAITIEIELCLWATIAIITIELTWWTWTTSFATDIPTIFISFNTPFIALNYAYNRTVLKKIKQMMMWISLKSENYPADYRLLSIFGTEILMSTRRLRNLKIFFYSKMNLRSCHGDGFAFYPDYRRFDIQDIFSAEFG